MKHVLLIAALLVASVAPAWAQSDSRWIAVFHTMGDRGKGKARSTGYDATYPWLAQTHHIARTIFDRTGTPVRVFSLPDTLEWSALLGGPRLNGEADSTRFRRAGCMGWIMTHQYYSSSFDGSGYTGESVAYHRHRIDQGHLRLLAAVGPVGHPRCRIHGRQRQLDPDQQRAGILQRNQHVLPARSRRG